MFSNIQNHPVCIHHCHIATTCTRYILSILTAPDLLKAVNKYQIEKKGTRKYRRLLHTLHLGQTNLIHLSNTLQTLALCAPSTALKLLYTLECQILFTVNPKKLNLPITLLFIQSEIKKTGGLPFMSTTYLHHFRPPPAPQAGWAGWADWAKSAGSAPSTWSQPSPSGRGSQLAVLPSPPPPTTRTPEPQETRTTRRSS